MGLPLTSRTDNAAPPRVSPSILVSTAPVMPTASLKAAVSAAASCPVMASTTSSVSSAPVAALVASSSPMSCSSIVRRPAVSTITTSKPSAVAFSSPRRAMSGGLTSVPRSNTGTSICSPSFLSWSIAAGRYTSVATSSDVLPCFLRYSASLPHAVVLPTPCKPAMRITVGPWPSALSVSLSPPKPPMSVHSSSATTLVNCCDAFTPLVTLIPTALSSTFLIKRRTTGRDTSASRSARRMSFSGALMFSALRSSSSFSAAHTSERRVLRVPKASARTSTAPRRRAPWPWPWPGRRPW
mmetsp:Transcript_28556/g.71518  ORF Transcript_28556/g.71518 Transcript_28556/m.71518 type:complete len:297 (+) Transcript_28556:786-1676(+)